MKSVKFLLIVLVIGIVVFATGFIGIGGVDGIEKLAGKDTRVAKTVAEIENIVTSISIESSSDNVIFKNATDNKFKIEYSDYENPKYEYSFKDGCASLTVKNISFENIINNMRIRIDNTKYDIIVYVPDTVNGDINIDLASGKVELTGISLNINKLDVDVASGSVKVDSITAQKTTIKTTSGAVTLSNMSAGRLTYKSSSGAFKMTSVTAGATEIDITSGSCTLNNSTFGAMDIEMESGLLTGTSNTILSLSLDMSSGSADISLTGSENDYSVNAYVTSGSIQLSNSTRTLLTTGSDANYGSGSKQIELDITSGTVKIKFLG